MNKIMLPPIGPINQAKKIIYGGLIVLALLIITAVIFRVFDYIENREREIAESARAKCISEFAINENNKIENRLKTLLKSQANQIERLKRSREQAINSSRENQVRADRLLEKLRGVKNESEIGCTAISDNAVGMLNEAAKQYNIRIRRD